MWQGFNPYLDIPSLSLNPTSNNVFVASTPKQLYIPADYETKVDNDNEVIKAESLFEIGYHGYHGIVLILHFKIRKKPKITLA